MDKIIIFDTTLRDGEQSPGASLGIKEKIEIARQLERLNVDIIEAGFPISSPGDFEAVKAVAREVKTSSVCALARAIKKDIDTAYQAVKRAKRPRVHIFLATSDIHMKYKLKKAEEEILRLAVEFVRYGKKFVDDIEFSPEDASRTRPEFLFSVVEKVIAAGAKTVNIPDTVGYATPFEFAGLIERLKNNVPNINKAIISVHCHNDLGLAVANSLAAVRVGAEQVECTINGIGERAGNASLEEIVMAVKTRNDIFIKTTEIKTQELYKTSRLVSKLTGIVVQPNKAIVGQNAFSHEAGIHQDGILKERTTYEIMRPQDVGFAETQLVLGKHSGHHAFSEHLNKMGFNLNLSQVNKAFTAFKDLTDKKKEVYDDDIIALIEEEVTEIPEVWRLVSMQTTSGTNITPLAIIELKKKDKIFKAKGTGDGPVDACYKTIDKITRAHAELSDYSIRAVTKGKDALGEVSVKLKVKGRTVSGRANSTDIIEASAKAYINALNKLFLQNPQKDTLTL